MRITKKQRYQLVIVVQLILLVGAIITIFYFYNRYKDLTGNPAIATETETKKLIADVGALIILPTDEQPTIATVSDPSVLRNEPFFASAQKGDRVLMYTKAQKAILYRPSENKIINIAPFSVSSNSENPQSVQSSSSTQSSPIQHH